MSCRCEQVSRASKQHDTLPALSRGERGEGTPRERLIVPPHGDRTVAAGEPPPLATPSGHASPDRPPNRDVPKNCARKSSSWLLSPASPRSSPWTTSGKLPRTATWTRRRSSSRRTRSWSTNPTPPGTYAAPRPRSQREISDRAPDASIHHLLSFYSTPPIFTAKPRSKHSRVRTHLHRRYPGSLTSPHERVPIHARRFLPLQWAALNNRVAVATYLIERGAAVNATDNDKQTPIHWASVRGSLPCAELLLRHGARLDQADCRGYDPVHVAAQYGQTGEFIFIPVRAIGLTK